MSRSNEYFCEAQRLVEAGDFGAAIVRLETAVESCEDDARVTKLLAKLNLRINEIRAFQSWCHESLRIDEQDPEPHEMLADYFELKGRVEEARMERRVAAELRSGACA